MLTTLTVRTGIAAIAALFTLCAAVAQAQQLYRWVDKDGRVTYSQTPPPAGAARSVQQKALTGSAPDSAGLPYAAQVAVKNFPVTLYTAPDCDAGCKEARESLTKRGIPHREVVVGDEQSLAALKSLTGKAQVPVLQVGRQLAVGFNPVEWKSALDSAGYPSSIPASSRPAPTVQRNLPEVKLYATPECGPPCQSARDLLAARGIKFQEVLVQDEAGFEELKKVTGGDAVPVLFIGSSSIRGFDPDLYQSSLSNAGFPRSGTPATAAR